MGLHKLYTRGLASWSLWAKSKKMISVIYKRGTQPCLLIYIPSVVTSARQQQSEAMASDPMTHKACKTFTKIFTMWPFPAKVC